MRSKKLISLAAAFLLLSAFAAVTGADAEVYNYCDRQDNKEAPYDPSYWVQPSKWGIGAIDASGYTGDVHISIDKVQVKSYEAKGKVQRIYFTVSGAEGKANVVSLHLIYDTRLTAICGDGGYVCIEDAMGSFAAVEDYIEDGVLEIVATANHNVIRDGKMFHVDMMLPDDAKAGDIYPIGIRYQDQGVIYDLFYNEEQDYEGKLMMTHVFTKGIENGYIGVEECRAVYFEPNGAEGTMDMAEIGGGTEEFTLPECSFVPPEGKAFICWKIGGRKYQAGDTVSISKEETKVTAVWDTGIDRYSLGNINGDSRIDIEDAVMIINYINGENALNDEQLELADIDGSGRVDIEDAVAVIDHVNGIKALQE